MGEALALLVPASAVALFVVPSPVRRDRSLATAIALAACLGIGFSAVNATVLIAAGVAPRTTAFVAADLAIWALAGAAGWRMRQTKRLPAPAAVARDRVVRAGASEWIARAAFGLTAIAALASCVAATIAAPHGEWDAWAIWNQRARFLFRGGGSDAWRAMVSIEWAQPDYPLLLPASVARVWAYAGQETTIGPALVALVFGVAIVVIVMGALDGVRRWTAGALVLGATTFLAQIPSQCADVPVACFIVAALVTASGREGIWSGERSGGMRALVAGAAAAMAAWTKNEGLVFLVLMLLGALVAAARVPRGGSPLDGMRQQARQRLLWGVAGALPVTIAIAWFKLALAPASPLFESVAVALDRAVDLDRHQTVALLMGQHLLRWGSPIALGIVPLVGATSAWLAIRGDAARRAIVAVVGLMFASYYLVYVTTPFEIVWHVSTSFDRLIVQLWPSLVLAACLPAVGSRQLAAGSSQLRSSSP